MEMNKVYDQLKVDLKRGVEYKHQLELEIKFLKKQIGAALKKGELLDEEIKEHEQQRETVVDSLASTFHRNVQLPSLKKTNFLKTGSVERSPKVASEKQTRCKIESMK